MNYIVVFVLLSLLLFNNNIKSEELSSDIKISQSVDTLLSGFLFINTSGIYHNGGEISVLTDSGRSLLHIQNKKISIGNSEYDLINEEHIFRDSIKVEAFYPEYGLFVLACYGKRDGYYSVKINNVNGLISVDSDKLEFKTLERYILETYPIPSISNPLREKPFDESNIVNNYSNYTYTPIEIKGEWMRVKDNKDCYIGEEPSPSNIEGWIRWKRDGVFILKVGYMC